MHPSNMLYAMTTNVVYGASHFSLILIEIETKQALKMLFFHWIYPHGTQNYFSRVDFNCIYLIALIFLVGNWFYWQSCLRIALILCLFFSWCSLSIFFIYFSTYYFCLRGNGYPSCSIFHWLLTISIGWWSFIHLHWLIFQLKNKVTKVE